jgi:hypothetical protein
MCHFDKDACQPADGVGPRGDTLQLQVSRAKAAGFHDHRRRRQPVDLREVIQFNGAQALFLDAGPDARLEEDQH